VCNDLGVYAAGVAKCIRDKWDKAYVKYKKWSQKPDFQLGSVQFVMVEDDIAVCNMVGQHGIGFSNDNPPIRYDAVDSCLRRVANVAKEHKASVHMPFKMGCGLAHGNWEEIQKLINKNLCEQDIEVILYQLNEE
jgi:hypothetical protein